jgi:hypothetical protein
MAITRAARSRFTLDALYVPLEEVVATAPNAIPRAAGPD